MKVVCPTCLKEIKIVKEGGCYSCGSISWKYPDDIYYIRNLKKVRFLNKGMSIEVFNDYGFFSTSQNTGGLTIYPSVSKIIDDKIILDNKFIFTAINKSLPPWQVIIDYIKYINFR